MKTHPHWQQHVAAWRHSGLSQAAYCRLHALNGNTFSRWVWGVAAEGTALGVCRIYGFDNFLPRFPAILWLKIKVFFICRQKIYLARS